MKHLIAIVMSCCMLSCSGIPPNVTPVSDFELENYLGLWFEIARLDHRFERGLDQVTANYSLQENGNVKVLNKGYLQEKDKWKEAEGNAKFSGAPDQGYFEVSFFGPFYGPYVIYELDREEYQYAFVSSGEGYLWFLARTPTVPEALMDKFIRSAQTLGYTKDELIFVNHD